MNRAPDGDEGRGATARVAFTGIARDGEAAGRLPDGRAVFVAGGLPGESAEVEVFEAHKRFARARLVALPVPPSPERVEPPCPHYGAWPARGTDPGGHCGGCHLQHAAYAAQLRYKEATLRDALRRTGGLAEPPVEPVIGMAEPWAYRNALRLHAAGGRLGFVARDGRTLVPVADCPIAHPLVAELIAPLAAASLPDGCEVVLRAGTRTGQALVVLYDAWDAIEDVAVEVDASVVLVKPDGALHVVAGSSSLVEVFADRPFRVPATAFCQANTLMTDVLVAAVREAVPEGTRHLLDAYCGIGLFAVSLAARAAAVTGIDVDPHAIDAALDNGAEHESITWIEGPLDEGLAALDAPVDVVVVDPPRTGLDPDTRRLLAGLGADRIVYVSCAPHTLARDVAELAAAGYRLTRSRPIDMFPQTAHLESVNELVRA